ncbi:hypothetical protein SAMN06265348_12241 [Pedobacter westerhofensis]|uniref:Uncharacterized protein n=1 Tax=Pedobacter westerhofensis TaxID=425512 RepID=A0A521FTH8_9SPHI|nr:hypothetical protein [Pedobacter westerhofensis]SMO99404.1 hypothetical protein SAMN06265348_12241 [Pedobacter westerhofensis]
MFFHHLKNFSPYSGHIYDDMKVSFIHKKSGHLGKKDNRFDLIDKLGYFPFRELIRDGKAYFISDTDLYDFLNMKESTSVDYTNESYGEWDLQQKEIFEPCFFDGYKEGISAFQLNLGVSYPALPHEQKVQYLKVFCLHCLDFLYFDGDLDKDLFYNLGYLQASLYRGFIEINNINSSLPEGSPGLRLHFDSHLKVVEISKVPEKENPAIVKAELVEQPEPEKSTPVIEKSPSLAFPRIELMCDLEEVKAIWRVLTAPMNTSKGKEEAALSNKELTDFLGSAFGSNAFPQILKRPENPFVKRTSRGDMRSVLNALMYSTYNLNHEYNRSVNQIEYVTSLKRHFSVFDGSKPESIKNVISANALKGMKVIKESQPINPHIEEMLSILKKHKLLH